MTDFLSDLEPLCAKLEELAPTLEEENAAPLRQFELLAEAGVLGWVIPAEYGGSEISSADLLRGYERLAQSCLTTVFVLTQRNGACQRIAGCENEELKAEWLPLLCRGEKFATVGISHLTTSRQHITEPAVQVELTDDEMLLNGSIPWVTGSTFADVVLTGGTCADGRQVLLLVETNLPGVEVIPPTKLLALNASQTGSIKLSNVSIPQRNLVAGPIEGVMKRGQGGGTGSLGTSALAIGSAAHAINRLAAEAKKRTDLIEIRDSLRRDHQAIYRDMLSTESLTGENSNPCFTAESVRQRANSLCLRSAQAYLAATKGAGFVSGHPAERLVRESMFFLVWSCPQPVLTAALREFACVIE